MVAEIILGILTAWIFISILNWLFKPRLHGTDNQQYEPSTDKLRGEFTELLDREKAYNSSLLGTMNFDKLLPIQIQELHKACTDELETLGTYERRLFAVVVFTRTLHKYDRLYSPEMIESDYKEWLQKTIDILDIWDTVHLTGWTDELQHDYDTYRIERMGIEERIKNYADDPVLNILKYEHTHY